MSTNKILLKFAKKGINLSPEAYNKVINADDPVNYASSLIVKLKSNEFSPKDLVSVSGEMVDEINGIKKEESNTQKTLIKEFKTPNDEIDTQKPTINEISSAEIKSKPEVDKKTEDKLKNDTINNLKKESDTSEKYINKEILEASETIKDEKIKFKRNEQKTNVEYDFKIIQDTSKKSYTSGELENLISYFKSRYEKLANILSKRPELRNYTKIADIEDSQDT